eukprot:gnl/Trimastix_PCT/4226.p1 GENE.gnl/Trimastix_PCT/4226~~gnl/Trimastix_PCT/4226.p1  ORF type:complete len:284 (-),score=39.12 gnl/Trimastix_PCT/4226:204-1055(-)
MEDSSSPSTGPTNCDPPFDPIECPKVSIPLDEQSIAHTSFKKPRSDSRVFFIVTNKYFRKIDFSRKMVLWRADYRDIHRVDPHESNPLVFCIMLRISPSLFKSIRRKKPEAVSSGPTKASCFFRIRSYQCKSELDRDMWIILFLRLMREAWQAHFESTCIPEPAIYQYHIPLTKVNRHRKEQVRVLVLSTERVLLVQMRGNNTEMRTVKAAFDYRDLVLLQTSRTQPTLFSLKFQATRNIKSSFRFFVRTCEERRTICAEINRLYYTATKEWLNWEDVHEIPF